MGWIDKAEKKIKKKVVDEVEDFVEDLIENATDTIQDIGEAAQEALSLGREARNRIDYLRSAGIASRARKAVADLGDELVCELKDRITEEMLEGMADALDEAADVIEMLAPDQFGLVFGVEVALIVQCEVTVSVDLPNPVARLTEIRHWADNPPKKRADIIECIKDFGPDGISVEAKVSGNGISATWSGDDKYDRIDAFLEKHGVS